MYSEDAFTNISDKVQICKKSNIWLKAWCGMFTDGYDIQNILFTARNKRP